jgi:hypothetical protein
MLEIETRPVEKSLTDEPRELNDVILKRGHRTGDTATNRATEIERSGDPDRIRLAALRLQQSEKPQKVLLVPHSHIPLAAYIMASVGVSGTVKNLSGTRSVRVRKQAGRRLR